MSKNQLFRKVPSKDFVIRVLKIYGIDGFDLTKNFTLLDLKKNDVVLKINNIKNEFEKYYLVCKHKYINNLTEKKALTILRQLLRLYGFKLYSKEKCVKGNKFSIFRIIENEEDVKINENIIHKLKVCFD